jgi:hypothetical protein
MTLRRVPARLALRRSATYMTEIAQANITAANDRSTMRADVPIIRKLQLMTLDNRPVAAAPRIIESAGVTRIPARHEWLGSFLSMEASLLAGWQAGIVRKSHPARGREPSA